jgi:hypothetical protein
MGFAGHLSQTWAVADDAGIKGIFISNPHQIARIAKRPAVKRADEDLLIASGFGNQHGTTVTTDIVKRLNARFRAGDDNGFVLYIEKKVIAEFG